MGFQLVVAVDPLRDVDRSVRRAAEEREWLKVAGGSKAHLLEVPSLQGISPSPGWNSMRDFFLKCDLFGGEYCLGLFVCLFGSFFLSFF